ncbi:MAG: nucleoside hydrolase [Verrucomicrobia bacterium]|nr:nucleoside hydrolase [Verrucomicrobiota bacterium]
MNQYLLLTFIINTFCFSFVHAQNKTKVIHSSDAGADDYVTTCVLALEESVDVKAIIITNADCIPEYGLSAYGKLVSFLNQAIPYGLSASRTWNQFPWHWREDTIRVHEIPCLAPFEHIQPELIFDGNPLFIETLESSQESEIAIIATGPLTTLSDILKNHPHLKSKISALYWMGGAINVPGNITDAPINKKALNDKAEWNVFADAFAADWIFNNTTFDIFLVPLDVTNYAKITPNFLDELRKQKESGLLSAEFILSAYQAVCDLELYYMWDVVTAVVFTHPEFFEEPVLKRLKVRTEQADHGVIISDDEGRDVHVYFRFKNDDVTPFHQYILDLAATKLYPSELKNWSLASPES